VKRWLCFVLLMTIGWSGIGCSGQATTEGKVDVESPQQYQRKDRHVYKSQAPKTKPPQE
jgi:hypothetical protein